MAGVAAPRDLPVETLQERMVLAMVNEAAVCLEDGVVRGPRDLDIAMVFGTGFPPFRGGPLRHADTVGLAKIHSRLIALSAEKRERFKPAGLLVQLVESGGSFTSPIVAS